MERFSPLVASQPSSAWTPEYLVGGARHVPFPDGSFDVVFSCSVLQHFSEEDALHSIEEMARVVCRGGTALLQIPGRYGLRNLQQQARRGFGQGRGFDVRYWSPRRLRRAFDDAVGPAWIEADGFVSLNPQAADRRLLSSGRGAVVRVSELLRRASVVASPLAYVADSVYVRAVRR